MRAVNRRLPKDALAALVIAASTGGPFVAVQAITIRHDRSYSQYTALANTTLPQTGSVTGNGWIGSGTLISPTWVLTAGHVADPTASTFTSPSGTRSISARYTYPGGTDIGLVRLSSPITSVTPVRLYNADFFGTEIGKDVLIAGAGLQGTGQTGQKSPAGTPRAAQSLVEAFDGPGRVYTRFRAPGSGAVDLEGSGVQGDSGGGLFMQVNSTWAIAGVMSQTYYFGDLSNIGKYGSGGIYMRTGTSAVLDWILSTATDAAVVGGYVAAGPVWNVNSSGNWQDSSNWSGSPIPNGVGKEANFLGKITSGRTVYTDQNITLGTLRFDNTNTYQIAGLGSLSIDVASGTGSIMVVKGTHHINLPLFIKDNTVADVATGATLRIKDPMTLVGGSTFTKSGAGTLSIQAPVFSAAGASLAVAEGVFATTTSLGVGGSLRVSGGVAQLLADQHLQSLQISGGSVVTGDSQSVVLATNDISLTEGGKLDLRNGKLIVNHDGNSPLSSICNALASGRINSTWQAEETVIAAGEASDLFEGETGVVFGEVIDKSSTLAALTVFGDASLNGVVDSMDFAMFVSHYGKSGDLRWTQGNFDGDALISTLDFNLLAGHFGQSLASPAVSVVPEPAAGALLLGLLAVTQIRPAMFGRTRAPRRDSGELDTFAVS